MPRQRIALLLAAALAIAAATIAVAALTSSNDDERDLGQAARQAEDRLIGDIQSGKTEACERVSKKLGRVFERMLRPPAESIEGMRAVRVRTRVMYWMVAGQVSGGEGESKIAVWAADDITARNRVFAVDQAAVELSKWASAEKMGGSYITPDEYGYRAARLCTEKALQQ